MYGPQYVCTFTRAHRHDKIICRCTCHHIYVWVATSRPRAERSLYKHRRLGLALSVYVYFGP